MMNKKLVFALVALCTATQHGNVFGMEKQKTDSESKTETPKQAQAETQNSSNEKSKEKKKVRFENVSNQDVKEFISLKMIPNNTLLDGTKLSTNFDGPSSKYQSETVALLRELELHYEKENKNNSSEIKKWDLVENNVIDTFISQVNSIDINSCFNRTEYYTAIKNEIIKINTHVKDIKKKKQRN